MLGIRLLWLNEIQQGEMTSEQKNLQKILALMSAVRTVSSEIFQRVERKYKNNS